MRGETEDGCVLSDYYWETSKLRGIIFWAVTLRNINDDYQGCLFFAFTLDELSSVLDINIVYLLSENTNMVICRDTCCRKCLSTAYVYIIKRGILNHRFEKKKNEHLNWH